MSLQLPQSTFLDWSLRFYVIKLVFTVHTLFSFGKPKGQDYEPLIKSAHSCGTCTCVTLVVHAIFGRFVSFLQNPSLKLNRKTRQ